MVLKFNGYTLVELVLVFVLVGVLSASALPRFFNTSNFSGRFFYDEAMSAVRYAHKLAVASGCHTQIAVTSTTLTVTQRLNCTTGGFTQPVVDPVAKTSGFTITAPNNITLTTSDLPIYFDTLGRARRISGVINNYNITIGSRVINIIGETGLVHDPSN